MYHQMCELRTGSLAALWEVLWDPESTHFSKNSVGFGKYCVQYPAKCLDLGSVSELIVSVLSDKGICVIHIVIRSGHTWASESMFVISRCPAVTGILHHIHASFHDITCAEYITTWYWIPLMLHPSHAAVQSYCVLWHLTIFSVGLPATVKLMVQKYNMLIVPSYGCVIQVVFKYSLLCEIMVEWYRFNETCSVMNPDLEIRSNGRLIGKHCVPSL